MSEPLGPQPRRVYGHEQEYPGSYRWPLQEVLCPECGQWVRQYGDVSESFNGYEHYLCIPCGELALPDDVQRRGG
jgi:hypothetical protein